MLLLKYLLILTGYGLIALALATIFKNLYNLLEIFLPCKISSVFHHWYTIV